MWFLSWLPAECLKKISKNEDHYGDESNEEEDEGIQAINEAKKESNSEGTNERI